MKVDEVWMLLIQEAGEISSGYLTRRILPEANYDVYLAIERPKDVRSLILGFQNNCLRAEILLPAAKSFEVRRVIFPDNPPNYLNIQLVLTDPQYKDIFVTLVQDIVDHISPIASEREAFEAFIVRLRRWQTFLEKYGSQGLSDIAQRGLFGELWCLKYLLLPRIGLQQGVYSWTGPESSPQDFQLARCNIEVKTTITKQPQKLEIASERQLDDTDIVNLILLHISLSTSPEQGVKLPSLVNEIRTTLSSSPLVKAEFDTLLFKVGYLDIHASLYIKKGYIVRECNYYKVESGFPRITETELPNGIGDVHYSINISACQNFLIDEQIVISLIGANYE
jgi:hypothetical protein